MEYSNCGQTKSDWEFFLILLEVILMGNASFLEDFARRVVGLQTSLLFR